MNLFIFGLGYVGTHLAQQAIALGWNVVGTNRTEKDDSVCPSFLFSEERLLDTDGLEALEKADAVLSTIPPSGMMIDPAHRFYARVLRASQRLRWLGYLSTTAVYGDHHCNWVSEETPVMPQTDRAKARVVAEHQWLETNQSAHIFRLAGIYGPGKSAIDRAMNDAPIIEKLVHVFNRIHVEDIVQALLASIQNPTPQEIYNLSDDLPAAGDEVLRYAYQQLGKVPPEAVAFHDVDLSPMAAEFYAECKRVNADKIKQRLGIEWLYPDYKIGLASKNS